MLTVTLYILKKFRKLLASCGGAVVMSIACHAGDPGLILLEVACCSVIFVIMPDMEYIKRLVWLLDIHCSIATAKKQTHKTNVYLYISVLISHLETKHKT